MTTIYNIAAGLSYYNMLLLPVCIVYWFLKPGQLKQNLQLLIVAGNRLLLITGTIMLLWPVEVISSYFSGVEYEQYAFANRATGPYWWAYWSLVIFNIIPQLFWFPKLRNSVVAGFIITLLVNWGILSERFVIIVTSFHRDYLPSSWTMFHPFSIDWLAIALYCGLLAAIYWFLKRKLEKKALINTPI